MSGPSPEDTAAGLPDGEVLHLVFFSRHVDLGHLGRELERNRADLLGLRRADGAPLLRDLRFCVSPLDFPNEEFRDARFRGMLHVSNEFMSSFPALLLARLGSLGDLRVYYQDATHSRVREAVYSICVPQVVPFYRKARASRDDRERARFFSRIEELVSPHVLRADFVMRPASPRSPSG